MKYPLFFLFLFLFFTDAIAQPANLVLNPGFEELTPKNSFSPCEYNKSDQRFNLSAAHWSSFIGLTPDLVIWEENCRYPTPHGGNNMAGIITYHPNTDTGWKTDFHEYIIGELKEPLKAGEIYEVAFFVHQNDSVARHHLLSVYGRKTEVIPTAAGNIGVYFSVDEFRPEEDIRQTVFYEAIFPQVNHYEAVITQENEWKKISKNFIAERPYRYFAIGNFKKDDVTENTLANNEAIDAFNLASNKFWQKKKRVAYYCIDDVSITLHGEKKTYGVKLISESLTEKNSYTFKNVTFNSGKTELLPASFEELDNLIVYLKEDLAIKLEINGHTDNVGNEESNRLLSEKRAKAVHDYLIEHGIAEFRLEYRGFGESSPVSSNRTPEGRQKNRRVECRIKPGN